MDPKTLSTFYKELNDELAKKDNPPTSSINVGHSNDLNLSTPGAIKYRNIACKEAEKLTDACNKNVILNIYCRILPLDKEYIDGHQGQMISDVNNMLANKGMTATQYLQDACSKTGAPLVEFILRSSKNVGKKFMEEADEALKDAQKNNIDIPAPKSDENAEEIENQIVDIEKDDEYDTFIDKLKKKTVNKIVSDVSKIINDKKEEKDMTFDPTPKTESTVAIGLDYITKKFMKEGVEIDSSLTDDMLGLAIREATLNEIDHVFNMINDDRQFGTRIRLGHGSVITESAINTIMESAINVIKESTTSNSTDVKQRYESLYKEVDGNKYDVSNFEKVDANGKVTPMSDQEAKKVLDPESYKRFQNKDK